VNTFGKQKPTVLPLDLSENQFEIYNKISRNYLYSFLFESLTGPEKLSETSIMGFDPEMIVKGYSNKITIEQNNCNTKIIETDDPLLTLKDFMHTSSDQTYRYLGGAVGIINYDAIRLWEKIPMSHDIVEPLMEFGIYKDGILYDNKQKKLFYFFYDRDRSDELKISDNKFTDFKVSEISPNLNQEEFSNIVSRSKNYIHDGDIFQSVLSRRFNFNARGDLLKVYKILRDLNPSPYLYHLKMNNKITIGASPEMLIRVTNDLVETFPPNAWMIP